MLRLHLVPAAGTCHSAPFARRQVEAGGVEPSSEKRLRPEAYMLSSIPFVSPAALRMSKKRNRLVR